MKATALIAEDEPLLAAALRAELAAAWPDLSVVASVGNGLSAVSESLRLLPEVLFFDIRMPGLDGLGAATELADQWPVDERPMPQLVFVTAYDEYATRAFDAQAIDYVLKPVQPERLRKTVARLQQALSARQAALPVASGSTPAAAEALEQALTQWRRLIDAAAGGTTAAMPGAAATAGAPGPALAAPTAPLKFITASDAGGQRLHMVPLSDVVFFEAADKYVRVLTATQEHLIRTPLKQLMQQLDPNDFWQVHRAVVVRSDAIESAQRDDVGRLTLRLRGRPEKISVSRLYAQQFKAM
ncbi:LytTR family DNA-binding domain-containing protein [Variovorax dokdonensis]|uniref:LytTR family DNA-binding domain-containing protein n=1 Tax=Variovorax dokdonensis TaxID=344883 RepID=A0ABT7NEV8_9BURK|nr:LytTR family DNA-binding domain-containing protein [Variovorax dokdonensis]MDM0046489.1 LytTR family DNA-binding domain-containing protein [Variovorax dokdonensis]